MCSTTGIDAAKLWRKMEQDVELALHKPRQAQEPCCSSQVLQDVNSPETSKDKWETLPAFKLSGRDEQSPAQISLREQSR